MVARSSRLAAGLVALVMSGCGSAAAPSSDEPEEFRVIGYVTDKGATAGDDQLRQLTHLNYAFALPQADGTLVELANPWKLEGYVAAAHQHGVRVLISVGGWGWDEQFEQLAASDAARGTFVREVVGLVEELGLDGADIDWEYPDRGASSEAFTALMTELRDALPPGTLLTAAVAALGRNADGVAADVFPLVDFLNVMAYDGGEAGGHASMAYAQDALAYWADRGLPADQTVLGVPFYARPQEVPYRELVEADPAAAERDAVDYYSSEVNYNGRDTMRRKVELAMERASGIMFWKLDDDTTDASSLLGVIRGTIDGDAAGP
jgi:GH18 family chitinase